MYCKHCGKQIADNSKFCQFCGKSLEGNATNIIELLRHFIVTNRKVIRIVIIILICATIGILWYINTPNYKIVGEWQREIRIGTEINIFNDDGTFEHKTLSSGFGDTSTKGEWTISNNILTTSFLWEGQKWYDKYEIIELSSDKFVYKNIKEDRERHFKRTK